MNNDLISRSALKEEFAKHEDRKGYLIGDWEEIIDNAPTVERKPFATVTFDKDELNRIVDERVIEPIKNGELVIKEERPKGKWIKEEDTGLIGCSHCHIVWMRGITAFCPNCGADMRKGGKQ